MIDALIQGKLHAKAQQRTGKAGRPFVTAKVTTSAKDGSSLFVNVIAFAPDACCALLALGAGDTVALSGELATSIYQGKQRPWLQGRLHRNLRFLIPRFLTAYAALTPYHVSRKRAAMRPEQAQPAPPPDDHWPPPDAPFEHVPA